MTWMFLFFFFCRKWLLSCCPYPRLRHRVMSLWYHRFFMYWCQSLKLVCTRLLLSYSKFLSDLGYLDGIQPRKFIPTSDYRILAPILKSQANFYDQRQKPKFWAKLLVHVTTLAMSLSALIKSWSHPRCHDIFKQIINAKSEMLLQLRGIHDKFLLAVSIKMRRQKWQKQWHNFSKFWLSASFSSLLSTTK